MTAFIAIDTFSGAGGLSLGFAQAGLNVSLATEWLETPAETYRKNLGGAVVVADARELSGSDLLTEAGVAHCDVLAGGPPCQGFSVQRRGGDDDERNRLVFEFVRLVEEVAPRAFVMENVAAIAGNRGRLFLEVVRSTLAKRGYLITAQVLDAADYGVPQHRRRMFVVGVKGSEPFRFPAGPLTAGSWRTVRQAFSGLPDPFTDPQASLLIPNHQRDNISPLNRIRISHVPEGGGRADIPVELQLPCHRVSVDTAGHRGVYGRLWWDRPAGTITTKCNSFTRGRFAHPEQNRNITMREAARLQSFPDDFVFLGDKVRVAHQIGNAVPPVLAAALGRALVRHLESHSVEH